MSGEPQSVKRDRALIWGMIAMTGCAACLVAIIWKGPWEAHRQGQQLDILGWTLCGVLLIIALLAIALTGLGVAASVSRSGVSLNVSDEDGRHPLEVKTTTRTEIDRGDGRRRDEPRHDGRDEDRPPWERT